jgi:hypothetical protein
VNGVECFWSSVEVTVEAKVSVEVIERWEPYLRPSAGGGVLDPVIHR